MWFYDPEERTVTLKTIFGANPIPNPKPVDPVSFDGPDNITVSLLRTDGPGHVVWWGWESLIVAYEDVAWSSPGRGRRSTSGGVGA